MQQVTTTDFSTRSSPKQADPYWLARCSAWVLMLCMAVWMQASWAQVESPQNPPFATEAVSEISKTLSAKDGLQLTSTGEVLQLSTVLPLELPPLVEDALLQGIPVHFVQEARFVSERWYWSDKVVSHVQRYMRLSFQPLTRRWRLHFSSSPLTDRVQSGTSLGFTFDTQSEALAVMQRINRWTVAALSELPSSGELQLDVQMRIDTSQLPRPLQIGNASRPGWGVLAVRSKRIDVSEWH